jgi:hypothetical protein
MPGIHDARDLMPEEIAATVPKLYSTENDKDPLVRVKWFTPSSNWTWFVTEFDPIDRMAFGMVHGLEKEMGYISLDELLSVRGPFGLVVERDLQFQPKPLSQCTN